MVLRNKENKSVEVIFCGLVRDIDFFKKTINTVSYFQTFLSPALFFKNCSYFVLIKP